MFMNTQELLAKQLTTLQEQIDSIDNTVISMERLRLLCTSEMDSIKRAIREIDENKNEVLYENARN